MRLVAETAKTADLAKVIKLISDPGTNKSTTVLNRKRKKTVLKKNPTNINIVKYKTINDKVIMRAIASLLERFTRSPEGLSKTVSITRR
ncbi:hypothetical protein GCM10008094_03670 [Aidingimonas halophila]|nr:hypothetical protein GCM10008094_03670 [Aidingimonas halophila]